MLEKIKGCETFEFEDSTLLNFILDVTKNELEKNGFLPLKTSQIESLKVLKGKYNEDDEIVGEIFKFKDRGKRELGLRYDLTIPLIKYVSLNLKKIKFPFKRYEVGDVFRDGPLKKGRMRQFTQFDFDVIGEKNIQAEAENLITFFNTYKKLKIDAIFEINNNKILKGALLQNKIEEKDLDRIILSIDKLKKIGKEGVLKDIEEKNFEKEKISKSLEILQSCSLEELKKKAENKILKEGISELEELYNLIKNKVKIELNFSMSRGLNIYTGNIVEVYDRKKIVTSSIGAGGRYDKVISDYLNQKELIPSFGYSFGIMPIFEILKNKKNYENENNILIVPLKKEFIKNCFEIKEKLIKKNFNCSISYFYNIKKSFDYCKSYKIGNICILGENEIKEKKFKIKNLRSGKEKIV